MTKLIVSIAGIVVAAAAGLAGWAYQAAHKPIHIAEPVFFTVKAGASVSSVAVELQDRGIIPSAFIFKLVARLSDSQAIQAADYQFMPQTTVSQIYDDLLHGRSLSNERQVTLVEGWTMEQIGEYLEQEGIIASTADFKLAATTNTAAFAADFDFLASKPASASLEGYLFPDTYRFFPNSEPEAIIRRLLTNFGRQVDADLRAKLTSHDRTLHDSLILASVVEREVRSKDEMRVVAGIFTNRLDIGMPLQADSTVNYITQSGRARSTFTDLEIDSPYNTYKYAGLPQGPISNPGLSAIRAAAEPADTPYFFFLTDEAGEVYYGRDLDEHNRNRQLYL